MEKTHIFGITCGTKQKMMAQSVFFMREKAFGA